LALSGANNSGIIRRFLSKAADVVSFCKKQGWNVSGCFAVYSNPWGQLLIMPTVYFGCRHSGKEFETLVVI